MSKVKFCAGKVGSGLCTYSKVWRLGFHIFDSQEDKVFRLCYLKTKNHIYYIDFWTKVREICYEQG